MKRRLSLLLALIMVFSLFPIHAESFDELAERAGNTLQDYGAIKGGSDGNLMIEQTLKRQDAVVILTRLMGKEKEAESMRGAKSSFVDIAINYYEPYLALAEKNRWVEGKGGNVFGFNQDVTYKEFSAMLLRALGYDTTGKNYSKVTTTANSLRLYKGLFPGEDGKVIRGAAFILMNNTLETAPKGEKKALVYKLGYKSEPTPDKFSVMSADAVGLKAIDFKFSQPVNESTLNFIQVSKEKGKHKIAITPFMLDETTVRAILQNTTAQDTNFDLLVANVKSAKQEVVEIYNGSVTMSDTTPPEVLSVDVPNPKTLIVKVSEPLNFESKSFKNLNEFKIEGKALNGKVYNNLENEIIVELANALKPGDYSLEVSGMRDYAGFSVKQQDFNITVIEDKEAPSVTNATMLSKTKIKVDFNEPLANKGQFKVDGKSVSGGSIELSKNKMSAILTISPLGKAALVEVKVEYKGQKDIMGNEVKDFTVFTFKAEDDTDLPDVTGLTVVGEFLHVNFNKPMDTTKGKYSIQEGGKVVLRATSANGKFDPKDASKLIIDASSILRNSKATTYSLILENFVDASVRGNEMPKVVKEFNSSDKVAPTVKPEYSAENLNNATQLLKVKIYFSKEMDQASLLDMKNYTFSSFEYQGNAPRTNLRSDAVSTMVSFSAEDNNKTLVIEATDPKVLTLGNITLVGLTDKSFNSLPTSTVRPFSSGVQTATAFFQEVNGEYNISVIFTQPVPVMGDDVYKLMAGSTNLNLTYNTKSSDDLMHHFTFNTDGVTSDGKLNGSPLVLSLISSNSGDNAKSIYGAPAVAPASISDRVAPKIAKDSNGNPMVKYNSSNDSIIVTFEERVSGNASDYGFTIKDGSDNFIPGKYRGTSSNDVFFARNFNYTTGVKFPVGYNSLTLLSAKDLNGNEGKNYGTFDLPELNYAERTKTSSSDLIMSIGHNEDKFYLEFTMPITAENLNLGYFEFYYDGYSQDLAAASISSDGLKLEFELNNYLDTTSQREIDLDISSSAGIKDAANGGAPISGRFNNYPQ